MPEATRASESAVWYDRHDVEHGFVYCPLADRSVPFERCFHCGRLVEFDRRASPQFMVCDARLVAGGLGLDGTD